MSSVSSKQSKSDLAHKLSSLADEFDDEQTPREPTVQSQAGSSSSESTSHRQTQSYSAQDGNIQLQNCKNEYEAPVTRQSSKAMKSANVEAEVGLSSLLHQESETAVLSTHLTHAQRSVDSTAASNDLVNTVWLYFQALAGSIDCSVAQLRSYRHLQNPTVSQIRDFSASVLKELECEQQEAQRVKSQFAEWCRVARQTVSERHLQCIDQTLVELDCQIAKLISQEQSARDSDLAFENLLPNYK